MARATRPSPSSAAPSRRRNSRRASPGPAAHASTARVAAGREDGQLAARLGRDIVSGVFPPGALLPNAAEMGERFSASRTALREAYSKLSGKGLIVARPRIGTSVRPKADWNLLDPEVLAWHLIAEPEENFVENLFALRQAVEPMAAEVAARTRSAESAARIAEAFARMVQFRDGGGDLIGADLDFHVAILEATRNHFLAALGGLIHAALECGFRFSWLGKRGIRDDRLEQHRRILEAITEGEPARSRACMVELLSDTLDDLRRFRQRRGLGVAPDATRMMAN